MSDRAGGSSSVLAGPLIVKIIFFEVKSFILCCLYL